MEMRSLVNTWRANMRDDQRETVSCQVTMQAYLDSKELNLEDIKSKVEHREVPTEEAAVKSLGIMKKQHRGQYLATGRREEPKELTRGDCGSWRKLAEKGVPIVQQWHGTREKSSGKLRPTEIVDCAGSRHGDDPLCRSGTMQGTWASGIQS
jgi:hypothetical protein